MSSKREGGKIRARDDSTWRFTLCVVQKKKGVVTLLCSSFFITKIEVEIEFFLFLFLFSNVLYIPNEMRTFPRIHIYVFVDKEGSFVIWWQLRRMTLNEIATLDVPSYFFVSSIAGVLRVICRTLDYTFRRQWWIWNSKYTSRIVFNLFLRSYFNFVDIKKYILENYIIY